MFEFNADDVPAATPFLPGIHHVTITDASAPSKPGDDHRTAVIVYGNDEGTITQWIRYGYRNPDRAGANGFGNRMLKMLCDAVGVHQLTAKHQLVGRSVTIEVVESTYVDREGQKQTSTQVKTIRACATPAPAPAPAAPQPVAAAVGGADVDGI